MTVRQVKEILIEKKLSKQKLWTNNYKRKRKKKVSFEELYLLSIFAILANRILALNLLLLSSDQYRRTTSGKRSPLPFFLILKKVLLFSGKKCPDNFRLRVKFLI